MMIRLKQTLLILISLFYLTAYSQDDDKLYYIHQKENTEQKLQSYIRSLTQEFDSFSNDEEFLYVNFIPPMGCPRCEGMVNMYLNKLKEKTSDEATVINVLIYKKKDALGRYIKERNFPGNFLCIDTTDRLTEIFSVNNNRILAPYITKISLKEGRLIQGIPSLGINLTDELVDKLIEKRDFATLTANIEHKDEKQDERPVSLSLSIGSWNDVSNIFKSPVKTLPIAASDTIPMISKFSINAAGSRLIVDDYLSNAFLLYHLKENQWVFSTCLSPTSDEEKMFVDKAIDERVYTYLKENNVLNSMYLSSGFKGTDIYVMASLPKLILEESETEDFSVGYYNTPLCLIKNAEGNNIEHLTLDEISIEEYVFAHSSAWLLADNELVCSPLQKGWPAVGSESLPQNNDENPFLDSFYQDTKILMLYNPKDDSFTAMGFLDPIYSKFRLGYYVCSPKLKEYNASFYWTDKHIGKIYQASPLSPTDNELLVDLFQMDTLVQQMPYSETLQYMDSYTPFFNKTVVDFTIDQDNKCKALVCDGTNYYVYEVKKGIVETTSVFPQKSGDMKLVSLQIGKDEQGNEIVYALYQNNRYAEIQVFNL